MDDARILRLQRSRPLLRLVGDCVEVLFDYVVLFQWSFYTT